MTIFSSSLKQEVFYRLFEIYLNEGWSIIFKIGLVILKNHENNIVQGSFDKVVLILNSQMNHVGDTDDFIKQACEF